MTPDFRELLPIQRHLLLCLCRQIWLATMVVIWAHTGTFASVEWLLILSILCRNSSNRTSVCTEGRANRAERKPLWVLLLPLLLLV